MKARSGWRVMHPSCYVNTYSYCPCRKIRALPRRLNLAMVARPQGPRHHASRKSILALAERRCKRRRATTFRRTLSQCPSALLPCGACFALASCGIRCRRPPHLENLVTGDDDELPGQGHASHRRWISSRQSDRSGHHVRPSVVDVHRSASVEKAANCAAPPRHPSRHRQASHPCHVGR